MLGFPKPVKKEKPKAYSSIKRKSYEEIVKQEAEKRSRKLKEQALLYKTGHKTTKKAVTSPIKKTKSKPKQKAYKPACPYWSIFTDNLDRCQISGSTKVEADIHIHHIFGASNKHNSEKRGFIVPLRADWHDTSDHGIHFNKELDLKYKRLCQDYYLEHYGTREEFISEFGKWW